MNIKTLPLKILNWNPYAMSLQNNMIHTLIVLRIVGILVMGIFVILM
jgi:hypothetical protein